MTVIVTAQPEAEKVLIYGGPPGPQGPAGPSGGIISLPTNSTISIHKAVVVNNSGFVEYASADNILTAKSVVGITTQSAGAGANVNVQTAGDVEDSTWSWTAGLPIYLGLNGFLTQDQNVGLFQLQVANASSATKIIVGIKMPFIRG